MEIAIVLLAVALGAAVIWYQWSSKQKRRQAVLAFARSHHFEFSLTDPFDTRSFPWTFFQTGMNRKVENVVWGEDAGHKVRLFDYSYQETSGDNRSTEQFTCAMVQLPFDGAHLSLFPENMVSRLAEMVGFGDLQFEYDAFNRAFKVRCADRKFAFAVFDAAMMQWLLDAPHPKALEIGGPLVLVGFDQLAPTEWGNLLGFVRDFVSRIPSVVPELYPAPPASGSTGPLR